MMAPTEYISVPQEGIREVQHQNDQGFSCYETIGDYRRTQEDALVCSNGFEEASHLIPEEIGHRMWSTYRKLDASFKGNAGTTAASNYYDGKGNIITATLADAASFAAIYGKDGKVLKVVRLNSITHKPSDQNEKDRIAALGGEVFVQPYTGVARVNGILAVSRAIGDKSESLQGYTKKSIEPKNKPVHEMTFADLGRTELIPNGKPLIVSEAKIDITSIGSLTKDIEDDIGRIEIIVTCDGFTDGAGQDCQEKADHEAYLKSCLEKEEAQQLQGKELCKFLAAQAIKDGSQDNVSVAIQSIYVDNARREEPVFLGVYDGHGGSEASVYVAQNIGKVFRQQCALSSDEYMQDKDSIYQNLTQFTRDHPEHDTKGLYSKRIMFILNKIDFDSKIEALNAQKITFQGQGKVAEVNALADLINQLTSAKENWNKIPQNGEEFVNTCQSALEEAKKGPLKDYKESCWLINKLVNVINWVASFISDEPLIKSDSIKKIIQFKGSLINNFSQHEDNNNNNNNNFTP